MTRLSLFVLLVLLGTDVHSEMSRPFTATGFKICEVSSSKAIIWTRLTRVASRASADNPKPDVFYVHPETEGLVSRRGRRSRVPIVIWPDGYNIDSIDGAVPGSEG